MQPFDLTTLFDLRSFAHQELFEGILFPWEVLAKIGPYLEGKTLGVIEGEVSADAHLVNPETISIGKGSVVEPGAYIKGPCIIGEGTTVRHGAYMRGNCIAGDRCVIGHATEMKNSLFLDDAKAAHFAYLGDTIVGGGVNMGAGTRCANLRLDRGLISVLCNEDQVSTGLKKFGAILGDGAQTGCNAVLNPGTILERGAVCYPNATVSGYVFARQQRKQS